MNTYTVYIRAPWLCAAFYFIYLVVALISWGIVTDVCLNGDADYLTLGVLSALFVCYYPAQATSRRKLLLELTNDAIVLRPVGRLLPMPGFERVIYYGDIEKVELEATRNRGDVLNIEIAGDAKIRLYRTLVLFVRSASFDGLVSSIQRSFYDTRSKRQTEQLHESSLPAHELKPIANRVTAYFVLYLLLGCFINGGSYYWITSQGFSEQKLLLWKLGWLLINGTIDIAGLRYIVRWASRKYHEVKDRHEGPDDQLL